MYRNKFYNKYIFNILQIILFSLLTPMPILLMQKYYIFQLPLIVYNLLFLTFLGVFFATVIWACINFIKNRERNKYKAIMPLVISGVTIIILLFWGYSYYRSLFIPIEQDFKTKKEDLQKIVMMIEEGKLKTSYTEGMPITITLPLKYRYLSTSGKVWYDQLGNNTLVFFVTSTDVLDEHNFGFIYSSENSVSLQNTFGGKLIGNSERIDDRWFILGN